MPRKLSFQPTRFRGSANRRTSAKVLALVTLLLPITSPALASQGPLDRAITFFEKHAELLNPTPLQLDFRDNLRTYGSTEALSEQLARNAELTELLQRARLSRENGDDHLYHAILRFEAELQKLRLDHLQRVGSPKVTENLSRLSELDSGAFWYHWLLQRWTGTRLAPEQVMELGHERIASIAAAMSDLQSQGGLPAEENLIADPERLQVLFEAQRVVVMANVGTLFPETYVTEFSIAPGDDPRLAQTPGYYNAASETFYYNLFDEPYARKNVDWLLIHEAVPGHHLQLTVEGTLEMPAFREQLEYPGYREGWAAYVEQFGREIGLYRTREDRQGMLEWNMIRAVRMVLDVGLNYYHWSEEDALAFWQSHIQGQDPIAEREIQRMLRWPAQIQTYTVGAMLIEERREEVATRSGGEFDLREFHAAYLALGPVPMGILADATALEQSSPAQREN